MGRVACRAAAALIPRGLQRHPARALIAQHPLRIVIPGDGSARSNAMHGEVQHDEITQYG
jgi:hypothetical protein